MQFKKIIIVIAACLSITLFCLYSIPVYRNYRAEIEINAGNLITYRTLLDTTNWSKWYFDDQAFQDYPRQVSINTDKTNKTFDYTLITGEKSFREGQIQIIKSNKWNTKIKWTEKLVFEKNIMQKLNLLFHPSTFRGSFLQNVVQFKNHIEHPDNVFGGVTFERKEMPANKLITLSDTVSIRDFEKNTSAIYERMIAALPSAYIKNPGAYISQHDKINDSMAYVRVGIVVPDELLSVKEPFDIMDIDVHPAIVMHINKDYTDLNEDLSIMYEWLKKNDARPSTGFWIEHTYSKELAQIAPHPLTIIQEFYSLK